MSEGERLQPGSTRKGLTEGVACEHDEHLSKIKEWTIIYKMLNTLCQVPHEYVHKCF
jgi:hypothetical protein